MPYAEKKSCKVNDQEILHGEHACVEDKCVTCNDGMLEEDYEMVFGGLG